jgi:hypothetical protein
MPSELPPHLREPRIEETVLDLTQLATTAEAARNGATRILRDNADPSGLAEYGRLGS